MQILAEIARVSLYAYEMAAEEERERGRSLPSNRLIEF